MKTERKKPLSFLKIFMFGLFVFLIYLTVILHLQTQPFSDFKFYYETALTFLQGNQPSYYYKYFQPAGYPYLLALTFRLFNSTSVLLPQFLNALMLTIVILVFLKYPLVDFSSDIFFGYFIMVFNVNYLGMVSVLSSEIPYVFFLLLGLFALWWGFKGMLSGGSERSRVSFLPFIISGLSLGASQYIRSLTFVYLLIFSLIIMLGLRYFAVEEIRREWKVVFLIGLRTLGLTWLSFFIIAILFYWISGYGLTYMPLQKGLWNFYIGFNIESKGRHNSKDVELISKLGNEHHWNAEEINRDFRPIVFDRIKKNWGRNLQILPEKLYQLLNPKGIPYWAIEKSKVTNKDRIYRISGTLSYLNALALIVSIGAWFTCVTKRNISSQEFFAFCMVGTVFLYLILHGYLLEVQARYSNHLWMVMFWCYPVCQQVIWQNFSKIFRRK